MLAPAASLENEVTELARIAEYAWVTPGKATDGGLTGGRDS